MSLNHTVLSGQLSQDSELRYTVSGKPVLEFVLALPSDGDLIPLIRAVTRRDKLMQLQSRLKKGVSVIVEGQLRNRKVEIQQGFKKKQMEINLDTITILDHPQ